MRIGGLGDGGGGGYLVFGVVQSVEEEARGGGSEAELVHKGSAAWGGALLHQVQGGRGGGWFGKGAGRQNSSDGGRQLSSHHWHGLRATRTKKNNIKNIFM